MVGRGLDIAMGECEEKKKKYKQLQGNENKKGMEMKRPVVKEDQTGSRVDDVGAPKLLDQKLSQQEKFRSRISVSCRPATESVLLVMQRILHWRYLAVLPCKCRHD